MGKIGIEKLVIIGPSFFNYLDAIKEEIIKIGVDTEYIIETGKVDFFTKAIFASPILSKIFSLYIKKRHEEILNACIKKGASQVLFISPKSMSNYLLDELKENNIKVYLYMWDSFDNQPASIDFLKKFDKCASFDPVDVNKFNMKQINLFAEEIYFGGNNKRNKDFVFVGTAHSIRPLIIEKLLKKYPERYFNNFIHLYRGNAYYFLKALIQIRFRKFNIFSKDSISKEIIATQFKESKYVLDITHPDQNGLTSRSFEAIASGAILVTNNKNAKEVLNLFKDRIIEYQNVECINVDENSFSEMKANEKELYELSLNRFCYEIINLVNTRYE